MAHMRRSGNFGQLKEHSASKLFIVHVEEGLFPVIVRTVDEFESGALVENPLVDFGPL